MKKKLDPLPPSEDKAWAHADTRSHQMYEPVKCDHTFEGVQGNEVRCSRCSIGYYLSPGMNLKSGHIYKDDKIVI